tara:strand:- start:127 stop:516 length:390 start_codon:yes stop_codon:yes gene_type:complete
MKRIIIIISIIFLAIGCTDNSTKEYDLEKSLAEKYGYESVEEYREFVKNRLLESVFNPYANEVVLLSVKYKVDEKKIKNLLEALIKKFHDSNITSEEIVEYSKEYDIPPETIASLIIDFYSMQNDKDSM